MRPSTHRAATLAILLLLLAPGIALAQGRVQVTPAPGSPSAAPPAPGAAPPPAQAGQACISVANLTEYNWPVSIRREGRVQSIVNVKPREISRYCAPDRLGAGEVIIVTLKSSWFPVGECRLKDRGTMEVFRVPDPEADSGETTKVKCYEGGR